MIVKLIFNFINIYLGILCESSKIVRNMFEEEFFANFLILQIWFQ